MFMSWGTPNVDKREILHGGGLQRFTPISLFLTTSFSHPSSFLPFNHCGFFSPPPFERKINGLGSCLLSNGSGLGHQGLFFPEGTSM